MFLAYLDDATRTMITTKLRALGIKPESIMDDEKAFFSALQKALGRHNLDMLIKIVESLNGVVERAREALGDPAQFITTAAGVPDEVIAKLGGGDTLQANRGLGCPEALAKASALAKALLKYIPEEGARLAELEGKLWEIMTQECTVLSALARQVFSVEEA